MKICKNCGKECDDNKEICPYCGALITDHISNKEYMNVYHSKGKKIKDKKVIWYFLLGFILPYIGILIAYFVIENKQRSKAMVIGAISSSLLTTFIPIIISCFIH